MNVTNSIVDFFQGNPFNNPIGSLIEKATDSKNDSENWTLFMEVCDVVNSMEDGPKLAIRAIKRRILTEINKDATVILYTLTLLETCVKNCGYRFHIVVCSRDFLQEFERIVLNNLNTQNKSEVPLIVLNKLLYLLQTWHDSFKGQPDFKEIEILYVYLLECGVQFPMTDPNTMSPIKTPQRSVSQKMVSKISVNNEILPVISAPPLSSPGNSPQLHNAVSNEAIIDKLSKDLQAVQTNLDIMCELMGEYSSTDHIPDSSISLMTNLFEVNSEMQNRLLQLINRWEETQLKESSILFDMLRINDEMNSALAQYGRFERALAGANNKLVESNGDQSRISKSNVADPFAGQQQSEDFHDDRMVARKSTKSDQRIAVKYPEEGQNLISTDDERSSDTRAAIRSLSSQEFDQFLSEQAHTTLSINNSDSPKPIDSSSDRQNPFGTKSKPKSSELFDL